MSEEMKPGVIYFAETDFRAKRTRFGIKDEDRSRHVYIIGKTGMGKSTILENMAIQDMQNGHGIAFMDPHGSTADKLLDYVPPERVKDVVYFAPFDLEHPISFNVLEDVGKDQRYLVSSGLMSAFKKIWVDAWSARMEYILQNTLLALLEYPGATLLGVNRMLSDKIYRQKVVDHITDPGVKSFWVDEFAKYTERMAAEAVPAIQNKVGQFTSNPLIRNIVGQPRSSVNFRQIMDEKKILIINLSKGRMGEGNANLIGSMLITKLYLTAMSRANLSGVALRTLPPFYFFVDEFQSFANESFANILSESRKYKLSLTIAHQYIEQMAEEVRAAVFGNVGSVITFRVGPFDAEVLEKIFFPTFTKEDIVNLGRYQLYLTLMIDGIGSPPFSAVTLPPFPLLQDSHRDEIIEHSRKTYAEPRLKVEEAIAKWHSEAGMAGAGTAKSGVPPSPARAPRAPEPPAGEINNKNQPTLPPPPRLAVSLAALRPSPGSSGRRMVSETDKLKSKDELRRSLEKIMTKPPPPNQPPAPVKNSAQGAAPAGGEVPREVLEKMLKG
ncbi:MAG: type IV secretion system DNA-binding domain-containing protein [Candidatus Vogelbacteria bacterium]